MVDATKLKKLPAKHTSMSDPILPNEQCYAPVLGIHIDKNGSAYPDPPKLRYLIDFTRQFIKYRQWSVRKFQSVVGKWSLVMLLMRPLFSVFEGVYKFDKAKTRTVESSNKARKEL